MARCKAAGTIYENRTEDVPTTQIQRKELPKHTDQQHTSQLLQPIKRNDGIGTSAQITDSDCNVAACNNATGNATRMTTRNGTISTQQYEHPGDASLQFHITIRDNGVARYARAVNCYTAMAPRPKVDESTGATQTNANPEATASLRSQQLRSH